MRWFFDDEHFRISKSVMVADLQELIARIMEMDNVSKPALSALALDDLLHHSLDDFEGQKMNPYEADAIEMAIRTGDLPEDLARILHNPDQFPPGSSQFEIAKSEALARGRKMINEAAQLQNEMNEGRYSKKAPLPFMDNGELHPAYREVVRSSVAKQTGKSRRTRGDTDFNPFDESGKLVTRLVSTYAGGTGKDEGFARWYEPAAKDLGYLNRRYKKGGRNAGQKQAGHEFMIPAHYVHHNTVQVMDDGVMRQIADSVKSQQANGISDIDQILSGVRDLPVMHGRAHRSGNRFESVHGRISHDQERASNMKQGLGDPETGEMMVDGEVPDSLVRPSKQTPPSVDILHDSLKNTKWGQWLANPRSSGNQHYSNGGKTVRRLLQQHHGFDEEQVNRIFETARVGSGRIQDRILHAIHQVESEDGAMPPWFSGTPMAHEGGEMGVEDIIQPPTPQAQPISPIGPMRPNAPPADQRRRPEAAQKRGFPRDPRVEEYFRTRMGSGINPNQQVYGSPETRRGGSETLSGLSELLSRLNNSTNLSDTLLRSDEYKTDFEKYIEEVQMEMAKTVIDDYAEVTKMSPESPLDLAMLSSRIQRPTNDVISIYHTRGDWRNIAKSFNITHEKVQLVKVALNG